MATRSEHEVTVVYDADRAVWLCWTDMPAVAKKWKRLGWAVQVAGVTRVTGKLQARSWSAEAPQHAVAFRRAALRPRSEAQKAASRAAGKALQEARNA